MKVPIRNCYLFCKQFLVALIVLIVFLAVIYAYSLRNVDENVPKSVEDVPSVPQEQLENNIDSKRNVSGLKQPKTSNHSSTVSDKVHIFYYPW